MIFVCQGHQHSIALEVFFKAVSLLSEQDKNNILLVGHKESAKQTLESLAEKPRLSGIHCHYLEKSPHLTPSHQALTYCLNAIKVEDILITLPTSKDQLPGGRGYTQFFRQHYRQEDLPMAFESPTEKILLITDHIPLREVPDAINSEMIISKVKTTLNGHARLQMPIEEVFFAGINPHAGENGLLGDEEVSIVQAMATLKGLFPQVSFQGPFSGDTLHRYKNRNSVGLLVYMYHDQGLVRFKAENGTLGINITFGLPFLRLSVDHGTAFELYKKDCADYTGMHYVITWALKRHFETQK